MNLQKKNTKTLNWKQNLGQNPTETIFEQLNNSKVHISFETLHLEHTLNPPQKPTFQTWKLTDHYLKPQSMNLHTINGTIVHTSKQDYYIKYICIRILGKSNNLHTGPSFSTLNSVYIRRNQSPHTHSLYLIVPSQNEEINVSMVFYKVDLHNYSIFFRKLSFQFNYRRDISSSNFWYACRGSKLVNF